ncbi:class I SAM-dependent methyltransferase [Granulosicoccaceae sp. 1_MG-2023]|nr:class I SAM-dependent methyltransferase [Granulosicoccaceae sp. 1_MG-2023]
MKRRQYPQGELTVSSDPEQISRLLNPADGVLLELGCGTAATTRRLAAAYPGAQIIATEVDAIALAENRRSNDLPNVRFQAGGAEAIDLPDNSVDSVIMLKSLHHVPVALMDQAFAEIARVLKPGGLAYFSEPVFAGEFNAIMRLFHDEEAVRDAAYAAIERAIQTQLLEAAGQVFFYSRRCFDGFAAFESRILGATHTDFSLEPALLEQVRQAFNRHLDECGKAEFLIPQRVDLLRKRPAGA